LPLVMENRAWKPKSACLLSSGGVAGGVADSISKSTSPFSRTYALRLHASNVRGLKERAGFCSPACRWQRFQHPAPGDGKSVTISPDITRAAKFTATRVSSFEQSSFLGDQYVSIIPVSNAPPVLVNGDRGQLPGAV